MSNSNRSVLCSLDVGGWTLDVFWLQTELVQFIHETIRARGPQSFAWFMQQALYHPEQGYYSSGRCAIGRGGDYFTNVSVGPVFGQLLAVQFAQIWEHLGKIDDFIIVEQGAYHGEFARDVLESARKSRPDFFAALRYQIIEPFPVLQDRQSETLAGFEGKIEWRESIDALEAFTGVHFSNELLDAMPVHLIVSGETKTGPTNWLEKFVSLDGDEFAFVLRLMRRKSISRRSIGSTMSRASSRAVTSSQPIMVIRVTNSTHRIDRREPCKFARNIVFSLRHLNKSGTPTSPRMSSGQVLLSVPRHAVYKSKASPINIISSQEYFPN